MVLEAKIQENRQKDGSKNHIFFACVFLSIWERFGEDFGKVLAEVWELLGVSWETFKRLFSRLVCQEGLRGSKRRPRGLLGSIWDGFGGVLGPNLAQKNWKKSQERRSKKSGISVFEKLRFLTFLNVAPDFFFKFLGSSLCQLEPSSSQVTLFGQPKGV